MLISIINNKGGVGKSTITQALSHALANKGKKVLVIDQDPQSNTSSVLQPLGGTNTLYNLYKDRIPAKDCIYPTPYDGIFILPNINKTDTLESGLYKDLNKSYFLLKESVQEYAMANFDVTLVDCPPNLGLFVLQSLIFSQGCIVPIEAGSMYSIDGFVSAYEAIQGASSAVNHELRFLRAVVNKVDLRVTIHKSSLGYLRSTFGDKIFNTTIPANTDIQKAEAERKTVIRYNPHCSGAQRFKMLADELLEVIGDGK